MLPEGVLSIAIRADFLATPEKRKKSRIDQILASVCCPRQNEHITWTVNANSLKQDIIVIKEICS